MSAKYTNVSDEDLDGLVQTVCSGNKMLGPNSVKARIQGIGAVIQRRRIRESMLRVDPAGSEERKKRRNLKRRSYKVPGPNSLWHLDGNHKLIRWKVVIHAGIDGYSRMVVFIRASNNNRSTTVFQSFTDGITKYGIPSRIRVDHGGENVIVAEFMERYRGTGRGSVIRGASVHNQRIERLWLDVWYGVTNVYYNLFTYLETSGMIDPDNDIHLWLLHYIYLPRINRDLEMFQTQWNMHGLRTENFQSPQMLYVSQILSMQERNHAAVQEIFQPQEAQPREGEQIPNYEWKKYLCQLSIAPLRMNRWHK